MLNLCLCIAGGGWWRPYGKGYGKRGAGKGYHSFYQGDGNSYCYRSFDDMTSWQITGDSFNNQQQWQQQWQQQEMQHAQQGMQHAQQGMQHAQQGMQHAQQGQQGMQHAQQGYSSGEYQQYGTPDQQKIEQYSSYNYQQPYSTELPKQDMSWSQ